jgi:hypothetical protein
MGGIPWGCPGALPCINASNGALSKGRVPSLVKSNQCQPGMASSLAASSGPNGVYALAASHALPLPCAPWPQLLLPLGIRLRLGALWLWQPAVPLHKCLQPAPNAWFELVVHGKIRRWFAFPGCRNLL